MMSATYLRLDGPDKLSMTSQRNAIATDDAT